MVQPYPSKHTCAICKQSFFHQGVVAGKWVTKEITKEIKQRCPNWDNEHYICHNDLAMMRSHYVQSLILSEKSELTSLEQALLNSLHNQSTSAINGEKKFEHCWSYSELLADKIARFGGSWKFIISFGIFITLWIGANSFMYFWKPADPYPFIFLNLILSCIAAIQAPVIMMSQNRQEAKDRIRSQHDYQINLKAEREIQDLHKKMDYLLSHQWEKMMNIQEIQLELLAELNARRATKPIPIAVD
jgi:uncharacterized membrane protein